MPLIPPDLYFFFLEQLWSTYILEPSETKIDNYLEKLLQFVVPPGCKSEHLTQSKCVTSSNPAHKVIELMTDMGLTNRELETYPPSVIFLLHDAIWQSRENPPSDWPAESYTLLQRPDLAAQAQVSVKVC